MFANIQDAGNGRLRVSRLDAGGGSMGVRKSAVIGPGDKWMGWKHSRLVALVQSMGYGEHEILSKADKRLLRSVQ